MLCQECNQKQASVHLAKILNGKKTEIHLCDDCARQREDFIHITPFSVNDLLAGFMEVGKGQPAFERPASSKCAVCGMDYSQFKKIGRLGCQECYRYFGNELGPVLRKIQGSMEHTGKYPKRCGVGILLKKQISALKVELKKAIELEAFEKAAEIRDQLKLLEQSMEEQGRENG